MVDYQAKWNEKSQKPNSIVDGPVRDHIMHAVRHMKKALWGLAIILPACFMIASNIWHCYFMLNADTDRLWCPGWTLRTFHRLLRNCHEAVDRWNCQRCSSAAEYAMHAMDRNWMLYDFSLRVARSPRSTTHWHASHIICNAYMRSHIYIYIHMHRHMHGRMHCHIMSHHVTACHIMSRPLMHARAAPCH